MTLALLREFFGWACVINMGLLTWWFCVFLFAHDWVYALHSRWFKLSPERFDAIHYAGMAFFKVVIFLLNLTPYLVLLIMA